MNEPATEKKTFSHYQVFVIALLAMLQFSVVLDFMVLSPLGAILMPQLKINTSQFGLVVSAYAFSAGASGLLAAGFADRFDRKNLLLFFYVGFLTGTLLCAIATDYQFLLIARIVTGLFGGVISSVSFAIVTDLFKMEVRGRVMGFVQMAFAASQILGIPVGLLLANQWGWHSPFWMIVGVGILVCILMLMFLQPVTQHLAIPNTRSPTQHLLNVLSQSRYLLAFSATTLLATGGFMLMPFGSAFGIHNLGLTMEQLPLLYAITGMFSIVLGPVLGRLSDIIGKYPMFIIGSIISIVMVLIYTNLDVTPFWLIIVINVCMFVGISSRMISASALMTAIPEPQERGAFMSINSSVQQISGGVASFVAGLIVVQTPSGVLQQYDILGYVVVGAIVITMGMMYLIKPAGRS